MGVECNVCILPFSPTHWDCPTLPSVAHLLIMKPCSNPLGAVVHCADLISSELADMKALIAASAKSSPQLAAFGQRCEAVIENVSVIISCCAHQRRIIDDILTLSKLDSKLLTIAPSLTDVNSTLIELEKMFEADAQKFDVTLRVEKDLGKIQWAMLDTGRLTQVLTNLITNATKFTQKEEKRIVTIKVGVSRTRPSERDLDVDWVPAGIARDRTHATTGTGSDEQIYLHFTVSDTGCGFDEEQKTRIFERFSQASPRTHSKYGGSGLGLFISREMIELQGGEIGVSSRPGHGATFAFYIAARSAKPPQPTQTRKISNALLARHQMSQNAKAKLSILVVEDNLVNQKVLRMQLQKLGHEVHVVSHGGEALDFLRTTSLWKGNSESSKIGISIVLMDVEMPVMNGLECTRKIREAESEGLIVGSVGLSRLPIVAVSANAREGQVQLARESGVDDAISKPFRVADLMPIIERLVLV
jgi:CheY-like chemotaxis protein/anti-sigma regulatory factor (Ser/Thr protein kinase)